MFVESVVHLEIVSFQNCNILRATSQRSHGNHISFQTREASEFKLFSNHAVIKVHIVETHKDVDHGCAGGGTEEAAPEHGVAHIAIPEQPCCGGQKRAR